MFIIILLFFQIILFLKFIPLNYLTFLSLFCVFTHTIDNINCVLYDDF